MKRFAQMALDEHHEMAMDNRAMSDGRNSQVNQPTPGGATGGGLGTTGATGVGGSVGDAGTRRPRHAHRHHGGRLHEHRRPRPHGHRHDRDDGSGRGQPEQRRRHRGRRHGPGPRRGREPQVGRVDSAAKQQIVDASQQQLAALKSASGAELDRLYVQNAIQTHQKALDIVDGKMVATAQSPAVKQQLMQVRPELREHLEEAQQLQSNLG